MNLQLLSLTLAFVFHHEVVFGYTWWGGFRPRTPGKHQGEIFPMTETGGHGSNPGKDMFEQINDAIKEALDDIEAVLAKASKKPGKYRDPNSWNAIQKTSSSGSGCPHNRY
ncbi:unnamed protein product [Cyprideis torosa]|uniref:Uncharacterized protein n=1 Tax=Cyprideis torosa TaxID=163714 RepID=A0A7R8W6H3_9CRUS|nr:unnamed protein product [Cyprideis torosa]CAG0886523.1 unnamed protein product [Cyprideis torosa]